MARIQEKLMFQQVLSLAKTWLSIWPLILFLMLKGILFFYVLVRDRGN